LVFEAAVAVVVMSEDGTVREPVGWTIEVLAGMDTPVADAYVVGVVALWTEVEFPAHVEADADAVAVAEAQLEDQEPCP
jgi:hypothetical protein